MRTVSILLLVVALAGPALADAPCSRVDALPVIARIQEKDGTRFVLRGRLGRKRAARMARLAQAMVRDVSRRFLQQRDGSKRAPVDVCLFATTRAYRAFVQGVYGDDAEHSELGFYSPSRRLVVANLGRSAGNLRHELVHPLLGDDFDDLPAWLNEGLGALYGSARRTRSGFRFLVNYRLRHLQAARRAGRLPSLDELAASTEREVYGDDAGTYYALARYLLLYLEREGKLDTFVRTLRAKPVTTAWQRTVLRRFVDQQAFLVWTGKLRYPRRSGSRR